MIKSKRSIGFYTGAVSRGVHKYMSRQLPKIGVQRGMLHILKQLYTKDGVSQQTLSMGTFVDKAGITRVIRRMEEDKLIIRKTDPTDGRNKLIYLTKKGLGLQAPLQEKLDKLSLILTEGMTNQEKEELIRLLKISISNLNTNLQQKGD